MQRRFLIMILVCMMPLGFIGFGFFHEKPAATVNELTGREFSRASSRIERALKPIRGQPFTDASTEWGWQNMRAMMFKTGAKPAEAEELLRLLRRIAAKHEWPTHPVLYVPAYARQDYIRDQRVWVFGFAWELRFLVDRPGGFPGHIWIVVMSARPPCHVLGEISCG